MDSDVDYRPALIASLLVVKLERQWRAHAEVMAAAERMTEALRPFITGTGHDSAEAAANNLASWMQDPHERRDFWNNVLRSLRARGLSGEDLERAAIAVCHAWAGVP